VYEFHKAFLEFALAIAQPVPHPSPLKYPMALPLLLEKFKKFNIIVNEYSLVKYFETKT